MSNVTFNSVTKRFGALTALDSLNLAIDDGAFVSLLGPSGSGKSTTLNLLAGLIDIDGGEIHIGDRRVNDVPPDDRDIAMVFQNYALYPHMTVFENLAFPLKARRRRMPREEMETIIKDVSEMLGVFQLLDRYPKELSGGQQQRVALGRAMVRKPEVFLLDEPLSNLDARLRIRMRSDIKALHRRLNATIVYVTHDQAEAMTLSDRIAVFSQGRLQQYGTPSEIYNKPANMFVANFVGEREMNMMKGRFAEHNGAVSFRVDDLEIPLDDVGGTVSERARGEAICGVRMEAVRVTPEDSGTTLKGSVTQTELSGPDLAVHVRLTPNISLWSRADPQLQLKEGQTVGLHVAPAFLHFFEPDSEKAIPRGP